MEYWMLGVGFFDDSASTFPLVTTMVTDPTFPHYKWTEGAVGDFVAKGSASRKGMSGSPDAYDGLSGIEKFGDVLGVLCGGTTESRAGEHEVGVVEVFPTPHARLVVRVDVFSG